VEAVEGWEEDGLFFFFLREEREGGLGEAFGVEAEGLEDAGGVEKVALAVEEVEAAAAAPAGQPGACSKGGSSEDDEGAAGPSVVGRGGGQADDGPGS
jgi:hypothetical protein